MFTLRMILCALALPALAIPSGSAQQAAASPSDAPPAAEAIMARVAVNQDKAEAERSHYVYVQHAKVSSRKGKTVMCEEITDARVAPSAGGSHVELLKLDGRVLAKHKYVTYTKLPKETKDGEKKGNDGKIENDHDSLTIEIGDTDRDLVENMRANLIADPSNNDSADKDKSKKDNSDSKDGIDARLFPLTTESQKDYRFQLVGPQRLNGRDVFHIEFRPKDKNDFGWKGDAYIDVKAYQPVVVATDMARKVPLAVRTLLGTDVPGLGFTVVYAPQPDGVWFPVNFSTEFKIHVLFFFSRQIIVDAQNRDFEKTHVSSRIVASEDTIVPPQP